jgi:tRNA G46 methylase TrmB
MKRVPLDHPDYRYSEAKNPYSAKLKEFPDIAYSDQDTETHAGSWRTRFKGVKDPENKELHVEIGCNTGHVSRAWAAQNPSRLHIGIDWKFKIAYRGAEKAHEKALKNILFLRANVERLRYMFGAEEIDALYLFFPDPWRSAGCVNSWVPP